MANDEIEKYYRARAPEYEQVHYRDDPQRQKELRNEAAFLRRLATGKRVLELACGTGFWTKIMSDTAATITAVDIASEMLRVARKKEFNCPVTFLEADMFELSLDDRPFDMVALGFWVSHQPKQELEYLFRVVRAPLTRSGSIWMMDNNPPAEGLSMESVRVDEHGNNFKRRFLSNGTEYVILKNYFSRDDLAACFQPRFQIKSIRYNKYYWSVVLTPIDGPPDE
jgi:ubiquinone/menaquinone biosynthesis C-methylase UbiE